MILQTLSADAKRLKPQDLDTYSAVLKFYYYQANQTSESAIQAFSSLEEALQNEHYTGIVPALLAAMHGSRYMLDLPLAQESYTKMILLAENACKLDPNNLMVKVIRAFVYFACNEKERFFQLANECLKRKPTISIRLGSLAFHYMLYGGWDRGKAIMDQLMVSRVGYPLYFHGATILYYYRLREYDTALAECDKYDVPALFWPPMLRIAVLGQLERQDQARQYVEQLYRLKPDFSEKARYLISRYVKEADLVDHVIDGLMKAGITPGSY
jgi:tetratricopeptide (TPR) repeat protein